MTVTVTVTVTEAKRTIRRLTDEYAEGRLTLEALREARGRVLDALVGLEPEGEGGDTAPTLRRGVARPAPVPPAPEARRSPAPPVPNAPASGTRAAADAADADRRPGALLAGVAGVVLVVVAGLFLFRSATPPAEIATPDPAPVPVPARPVFPGPEFMEAYLLAPGWDESSVAAFLFDWNELTLEQRQAVRETEAFRTFAGAMRARLRADRALASPEALAEITALRALAANLGVDLGPADRLPVDSTPEMPDSREVAGRVGAAAPREPDPAPAPPSRAVGAVASTPATEAAPVAAVAADPGPAAEAMTTSAPEASPTGAPAVPEPAADAVAQAPSAEPASPRPPLPAEDAPGLEPRSAPRLQSPQPCSRSRLKTRSANCWDQLTEDVPGPMLRVLPAGAFSMGEAGDAAAEPVHEARIDRAFAIGLREISVGEYEQYCSEAGVACPERRWSGDDYPMVDVSWRDAVAYVRWLSRKSGATYRLPTEAEWEYAARAGSTTRYPFGESLSPTDARFDSGYGVVRPVPTSDRTTRENGWRLWHVAGNVREWTADGWRPDYATTATEAGVRVLRGGSYADPADRLRSAFREPANEEHHDAKTGFRVVRELEDAPAVP